MLALQPKDAAMSNDLEGDGNDAVDQRDMLDNMLHGALVALAITFTVATTLPPSSPALALDFDPFESNETSQDSPNSCPELNSGGKVDKGDVLKCDYMYHMVDYNDVKVLWRWHAQLSRPCKPRDPLQQLH